jgi:A/G-specific adenine glycosylase
VVVDANVERVVARLFAIATPLPAGKTEVRVGTDQLTPDARAGDFAQAMMDLGATVCTPRAPRCLLCPIAEHCAARAGGEPERFPVKAPKKPRPERRGAAFWITHDGAVWLERRAASGMLGGMLALPDDGWSARGDGTGSPPLPGDWDLGGAVAHAFTHFQLDLRVHVYRGAVSGSLPLAHGQWWPLEKLDEAGLPTLFAKAARLALATEAKEDFE